MQKSILSSLLVLALLFPFTSSAQQKRNTYPEFSRMVTLDPAKEDFKSLRAKVDCAPFIVIDKEAMKLTLVGDDCKPLRSYGISCAKVYGAKKVRGDHKTPEGIFKINEILNPSSLTHDFGDGKGPVRGAYGPWFLRLSVPGFVDIGIHGTHKPESIGTRDTEGCIRLVNDDIRDLKNRITTGTPVIILTSAKDREAER